MWQLDVEYTRESRLYDSDVLRRIHTDGYINQIIDTQTEPIDVSIHPTKHFQNYTPIPFTGLELAIKQFVTDNDIDKLAKYIINNVPRAQRRKLVQRLAQSL